MYRHCIFCHQDLGRNQVIEAFPVGRRLAFDVERGRLWVVCRRCARWNLTPIEERWEAIDECGRRFRTTPARASTEHVGLARLNEGLELIRIGRPLLPEFAGWRYGRQLSRRHHRYVVGAALGLGAAAATAVSMPVAVGTSILALFPSYLVGRAQRARSILPKVRIPFEAGEILSVSTLHMQLHALRRDDSEAGWELEVAHAEGTACLTGPTAVQALTHLMPTLNRAGASRHALKDAVSEIQQVGDPRQFFASVPQEYRPDANRLARLPHEVRLAVEIAANEDNERHALEGDLDLLERAWREAEYIASIADDLIVPDVVSQTLDRHTSEG